MADDTMRRHRCVQREREVLLRYPIGVVDLDPRPLLQQRPRELIARARHDDAQRQVNQYKRGRTPAAQRCVRPKAEDGS